MTVGSVQLCTNTLTSMPAAFGPMRGAASIASKEWTTAALRVRLPCGLVVDSQVLLYHHTNKTMKWWIDDGGRETSEVGLQDQNCPKRNPFTIDYSIRRTEPHGEQNMGQICSE